MKIYFTLQKNSRWPVRIESLENKRGSSLIVHNLIRLMMAEAALIAHRLPREISFKHTVQMWIAWNAHGHGVDRKDKLHGLFVLIAQQRVGKRPGRIEPRAVKRRPKPYPLLTKPRAQARAIVQKHGHPKKAK